MRPRDDISPNVLRAVLIYDPETGLFTWKHRDVSLFSSPAGRRLCLAWNTRRAGKPSGAVSKNGYVVLNIFSTRYMAHRVAWAMQTGEWPRGDIDHEDRDRANNKWSNLRSASRSENMFNSGITGRNTSGFKGVSWCSARQKWQAHIQHDQINRFLGRYDDIKDAARAYEEASVEFHRGFGRTE